MKMSHRSRHKEMGEVEPSPERSPEIELVPTGSEDWGLIGDDDRNDDRSYDRDDDDGLDIKPPQARSKRDKPHKHKHKEDRRRDRGDRERGKHSRDRQDKERGGTVSGSGSGGASSAPSKDRGSRDDRSANRPPKHGKEGPADKDAEARRREKSRRERERLERLERERFRLERERREHLIRAEREKDKERKDQERRDKMERRRRADDTRRRPDSEHTRSKAYTDKKYSSHSADRSRSPRREGRQAGREERFHSRRNSPREDVRSVVSRPDHPMDTDDLHDTQEEHLIVNAPSDGSVGDDVSVDEDEVRSDPVASPARSGSEVSENSASGSESESDDASQSASDSEHRVMHHDNENDDEEEEEEEEDEEEKHNGRGRHDDAGHHSGEDDHYKRSKVRSRFDDGSEDESETQSVHQPEEEDTEYLEDSPERSPLELKPDLPDYFPAIQGCRSVEEFHCLNRIAEGTYGVVYRAKDKKTGEHVALKRLKMEKEKEGFPITSLREINTLLKAQHPNIVTVREIVVGSNMDKIYIVMDYVEHDLKSLMETMKDPFISGEVKTLMIQLLRGTAHLHDNWIIHRDLKTSNLLLGHNGILKIGDFGLAREYGSPLRQYTPVVVTLWYRAPELLLGTKEYSCPIDMWSVGCIFSELLTRKPLFPGKSEIDQLNRIFKELGTPTEKIWAGVGELPAMKKCTFTDYPYNQLRNRFGSMLSDTGFDLMNRFLTYNPTRRITAEDALKHDYFSESPLPVKPSMFPTWPAKSEMSRRVSHGNSPKPPSGGKAFAKLLGDDDVTTTQAVAGPTTSGGAGFHLSYATKGAAASGPGFSLKF